MTKTPDTVPARIYHEAYRRPRTRKPKAVRETTQEARARMALEPSLDDLFQPVHDGGQETRKK